MIHTAGRASTAYKPANPEPSFLVPGDGWIVVTGIMSGVSRHTSHNVADKCSARRT